MTIQQNTVETPEESSGKNYAVETVKVTKRDVKLAFLAVGALIDAGAIPVPDFDVDGWHDELRIAVMSVAGAFATAGVMS